MSAVDPKVILKIRKLLALAKSPNAHEASSAMAHALRVMREHGIDDSDLALSDIDEFMSAWQGARTSRVPYWEMALTNVICQAFGVRSVRRGSSGVIAFYGMAARAELAAYSLTVLGRQLKQARAAHMAAQPKRIQRKTRIARGDDFAEAWVSGIWSALEPLRFTEDEAALLATWLQWRYGEVGQVTGRTAANGRDAGGSRSAGYAAGKQVRLNRPVGEAQRQIGAS